MKGFDTPSQWCGNGLQCLSCTKAASMEGEGGGGGGVGRISIFDYKLPWFLRWYHFGTAFLILFVIGRSSGFNVTCWSCARCLLVSTVGQVECTVGVERQIRTGTRLGVYLAGKIEDVTVLPPPLSCVKL